MANNRMYLVCTECLAQESTTWDDCSFYVAKYYPSSGWYNPTPLDMDSFFDKHVHGSLLGEYIQIAYETMTEGGQQKANILMKLSGLI